MGDDGRWGMAVLRGHSIEGFWRQINVFGFYPVGIWYLSIKQGIRALVISNVYHVSIPPPGLM